MKILGPATLVLVFVVRMLSEVAQAQVVPFTSIATGTNPQVDVADTANGKVFVANQGSNTVSVFDPVNWTKITDVATGAGPRRLRINGTTNKLYVVNQSDASVTVISATTNAVVQTITLAASSNPTGLGIDEVTNKVYVVLRDTNQIAVIDGATDTLVTNVNVGTTPNSVCINTVTNRVYVPNFASNNVSVIDGATNTNVTGSPVTVDTGPTGCLVDETRNRIIVANETSGTISAIDGSNNTAGTPIASGGTSVAVCSLNQALDFFVILNQGSSSITAFALDTLAPLETVTTGGFPWTCYIDQTPRALYVVNRTDDTVSVIDLYGGAVRRQIPTGTHPQGIARYFQNFYVVNNGSNSVSVFKRLDFRKAADVDGDGKSDLLWSNGVTGATAVWLMNGTASSGSAFLTPSGTWLPILENDVDGDGSADIVWRNTTTNETALWLMDGTAPKASKLLLGPSTWVPIFLGSFDGSAARGILWRNSADGAVALWLMNGTAPRLATVIFPASSWMPILLGNFDGDFHSDIVWRNSDGSVAIWLMQGDAVSGLSAKASAVILGPGTPWVPVFAADLDGDGRSDLVWRNTANGDTAVWLMNGLTPKPGGTAIILPGSAGWNVTHVRDLDGDAKADLIWRNNATGATAVWLMDGIASKPNGTAVLLNDPNWSVTHTFGFTRDLRGDLLWRNSATGQTAVWLMNGLSATTSAILLGDPNWSVVPPDMN